MQEQGSAHAPDNINSLLLSPIGTVLSTDLIILESDNSAKEAYEFMEERNARCVLASHKGEVVGIVSKTDILFKVLGQDRNPAKVKLREIMSSPVLAVEPTTTVKEALSVMDKRRVRQVMVHALKDASNSRFKCPYCESPFDTKESLSKHIDRLHGESGVLEGDVRHMFE